MIHELRRMLTVETPLGRGTALFIEAAHNHYFWTVVIHETQALVTFKQEQLRIARSYTHKWGNMSDELMKDLTKVKDGPIKSID